MAKYRDKNWYGWYSNSDDLETIRKNLNVLVGYDSYHKAYEEFSIWKTEKRVPWLFCDEEELKSIAEKIEVINL